MIPVSTLYDEYIDRPKLTEKKYLPDRKTRSADAICSYGTIREVIDFFCSFVPFFQHHFVPFFQEVIDFVCSFVSFSSSDLFDENRNLMEVDPFMAKLRIFFRNLKLTLLSLNKMVRYLDKMVRYQDGKMLLYKVFTQLFIMRCQMMKPYRSTA